MNVEKKDKIMLVGRITVTPQVEVEINRKIMKVVSSLKVLVRCISDHIGLREDVK